MDIATELMINEEIRDREVRLIDENGEQLGVMPTHKALELAEERGLDLAKIQPQAKPPVCKLLDYDKYRYEQSKRERDNRKNQRVVSIKEVQLSATIEENDVLTKAKMAQKFLADGDKVKVSFNLSSREFNGRWYTDVRAWRIEPAAQTPPPPMEAPMPSVDDLPAPISDEDLPF